MLLHPCHWVSSCIYDTAKLINELPNVMGRRAQNDHVNYMKDIQDILPHPFNHVHYRTESVILNGPEARLEFEGQGYTHNSTILFLKDC